MKITLKNPFILNITLNTLKSLTKDIITLKSICLSCVLVVILRFAEKNHLKCLTSFHCYYDFSV